jgi:hypothetical protein
VGQCCCATTASPRQRPPSPPPQPWSECCWRWCCCRSRCLPPPSLLRLLSSIAVVSEDTGSSCSLCLRTRPRSPTKDKPAAHRPPAGLGIGSPYPPGCEAAANGESPDRGCCRAKKDLTVCGAACRGAAPSMLTACCTWGGMGTGWGSGPRCTPVHCWAALAPPSLVIGTSLTVEACHGTNILQLSARKAARVNAELRASKIGRFDGTELAHDDPDAPGIITGRPVVGEIWSIGGAGSASRHRRQAQRKGESIRDFASSTAMTTKIHGRNRKLQRLHE